MMELRHFVPTKLMAALVMVREEHPRRSFGMAVPESSVIDRVRAMLADCSEEGLDKLAWELRVQELLACLEIIVLDREGEIAEKAARLLALRPKMPIAVQGWKRLLRFYRHDLLEISVRDLLDVVGLDCLEQAGFPAERVFRWLAKARLDKGVFSEYRIADAAVNLDGFLNKVGISKDDGLFWCVWRYMLCHGNAEYLLREDGWRLLAEINSDQNQPHQRRIARNYLNRIEGRDWFEPIIKLIERQFGRPNVEHDGLASEHPFWRKVNERARREFHAWFMKKEIRDFFDGERADFWEKYVESGQVIEVKPILKRKVFSMSLGDYRVYYDGFMLDFGKFGVVEFKKTNNAAYVYPSEVFGDYWRSAESLSSPKNFKDPNRTVRTAWGGTINHSGSWQYKTQQCIQRLLDS